MVIDGLALGKVNRASGQALRFGGKGINVSYVLKEFGGESVLTGFAAGFTGDALAAGLAREGFVCDFVELSAGNTRINVKLTSASADGDPDTELNAPGPAPTTDELKVLTDKLSRLGAGDAAVLAGSLPAGVRPDFVCDLAAALPESVAFICDLSGDSLRASLAAKPDFVKPNIHELYELLGIKATPENLKDRTLIADCVAQMISMGAKNVLVTLGGDGAYYATDKGESGFIPVPPAPDSANAVRSAVGCGDSAVAGWLMGMGYAGEDVRDHALSAARIEYCGAESAARLAVMLGSASYFFGFPPSPDKVCALDL